MTTYQTFQDRNDSDCQHLNSRSVTSYEPSPKQSLFEVGGSHHDEDEEEKCPNAIGSNDYSEPIGYSYLRQHPYVRHIIWIVSYAIFVIVQFIFFSDWIKWKLPAFFELCFLILPIVYTYSVLRGINLKDPEDIPYTGLSSSSSSVVQPRDLERLTMIVHLLHKDIQEIKSIQKYYRDLISWECQRQRKIDLHFITENQKLKDCKESDNIEVMPEYDDQDGYEIDRIWQKKSPKLAVFDYLNKFYTRGTADWILYIDGNTKMDLYGLRKIFEFIEYTNYGYGKSMYILDHNSLTRNDLGFMAEFRQIGNNLTNFNLNNHISNGQLYPHNETLFLVNGSLLPTVWKEGEREWILSQSNSGVMGGSIPGCAYYSPPSTAEIFRRKDDKYLEYVQVRPGEALLSLFGMISDFIVCLMLLPCVYKSIFTVLIGSGFLASINLSNDVAILIHAKEYQMGLVRVLMLTIKTVIFSCCLALVDLFYFIRAYIKVLMCGH